MSAAQSSMCNSSQCQLIMSLLGVAAKAAADVSRLQIFPWGYTDHRYMPLHPRSPQYSHQTRRNAAFARNNLRLACWQASMAFCAALPPQNDDMSPGTFLPWSSNDSVRLSQAKHWGHVSPGKGSIPAHPMMPRHRNDAMMGATHIHTYAHLSLRRQGVSQYSASSRIQGVWNARQLLRECAAQSFRAASGTRWYDFAEQEDPARLCTGCGAATRS